MISSFVEYRADHPRCRGDGGLADERSCGARAGAGLRRNRRVASPVPARAAVPRAPLEAQRAVQGGVSRERRERRAEGGLPGGASGGCGERCPQVAPGASGGGAGGSSGGAGGSSGGGSNAGGWTYPDGVTKPRIMIVGDSISAGPGCYQKYLLQNLNDNGYSNFEFVGEYDDDCGGGVEAQRGQLLDRVAVHAGDVHAAELLAGHQLSGHVDPGRHARSRPRDDSARGQRRLGRAGGRYHLGQLRDPGSSKLAPATRRSRRWSRADPQDRARLQHGRLQDEARRSRWSTPCRRGLKGSAPLSHPCSWPISGRTPTGARPRRATACIRTIVGAQKMGQNWYNALKGILKSD